MIERYKSIVGHVHPIAKVELVPSGGGIFEVYVNEALVFSKKQVGRHGETDEMVELVSRQLESERKST